MIRFAIAAFAALALALPAVAQSPPPKITQTGLFDGRAIQSQHAATIKSMNDAHTAQIQSIMLANQQASAQQVALLIAMLQKQAAPPAPVQPAPINIYLPPGYGPQQQLPIAPPQQILPIAPPQQQLPIAPPQQQLPIAPPQQQLPIKPPQQILPIAPPQQPLPVTPPQQILPVLPPPQQQLPIAPPTVPPPVGFQRLTNGRDLPPRITATITRADGTIEDVTRWTQYYPTQEKWK